MGRSQLSFFLLLAFQLLDRSWKGSIDNQPGIVCACDSPHQTDKVLTRLTNHTASAFFNDLRQPVFAALEIGVDHFASIMLTVMGFHGLVRSSVERSERDITLNA
jgi:hypothetical protein